MTVSEENSVKVRVTFPLLQFSQTPSEGLKYPMCQDAIFRGSLDLNPVNSFALSCPPPTFPSRTLHFVYTIRELPALRHYLCIHFPWTRLLECVPAPGINNKNFFEDP